jgi:hypothetical protein
MFVPALSVRFRLGALVLLASVLPLALQAPSPTGAAGAGVRPAAWLEAQVSSAADADDGDARHAFDRALAAAQAADARTLHGFLTAFLDAHARLTDAEAAPTEGRSPRALVQTLRQQLTRAGLVVRPPAQASAPPVAPGPQAHWRATSLYLPLSDPTTALVGSAAQTSAQAWPAQVASVAHASAAGVGTRLIRQLFAGRRLGP